MDQVKRLRNLHMAVDGFHSTNHSECLQYYSRELPEHAAIWKSVDANDSICESVFSWFKHYAKTIRRAGKEASDAIVIDLFEIHNQTVTLNGLRSQHMAPVLSTKGPDDPVDASSSEDDDDAEDNVFEPPSDVGEGG